MMPAVPAVLLYAILCHLFYDQSIAEFQSKKQSKINRNRVFFSEISAFLDRLSDFYQNEPPRIPPPVPNLSVILGIISFDNGSENPIGFTI